MCKGQLEMSFLTSTLNPPLTLTAKMKEADSAEKPAPVVLDLVIAQRAGLGHPLRRA
jgi:hypothetical protein